MFARIMPFLVMLPLVAKFTPKPPKDDVLLEMLDADPTKDVVFEGADVQRFADWAEDWLSTHAWEPGKEARNMRLAKRITARMDDAGEGRFFIYEY